MLIQFESDSGWRHVINIPCYRQDPFSVTNSVQPFSRQYKVGPGAKNAWPALHQWGICSGLFAPWPGINIGLQAGTNLTISQTRSLFISLSLYLSKMAVRICYYRVSLLITQIPSRSAWIPSQPQVSRTLSYGSVTIVPSHSWHRL